MAAFALAIEAAMALSILFAANSVLSNAVYSSSLRSSAELRLSDSAYDFFNLVKDNSTYTQCVVASNESCVNDLLSNFRTTYGLSYLSFDYGVFFTDSGNSSWCAFSEKLCLPLRNGSGLGIACLTSCGE